ncbi:ATP-binding protein [Sorangium sp. So ce1151]|uniref:ATP-binding protein n=1 Tax=Sorangium sp. So ce1151 TaxID=3133332 RepID=UPI003F642646
MVGFDAAPSAWAADAKVRYTNLPSGAYRADEKRLTQVLLNLPGNAIKFTAAGKVTLRVEAGGEGDQREGGRGVLFHVEDTGPGIAAVDLGRIFEPFEQAGDHGARAEGAGRAPRAPWPAATASCRSRSRSARCSTRSRGTWA